MSTPAGPASVPYPLIHHVGRYEQKEEATEGRKDAHYYALSVSGNNGQKGEI